MKKTYLIFLTLLLIADYPTFGQLATLIPADASAEDEIKIVFDAAEGNGELVGATKVYMHSGVVIEGPDGTAWDYVQGNWGADDGVGEMTPVPGEVDKWEIILSPSAREYYGVEEGTTIFRLSMVFRDAAGSSKASISPGDYDWGFVAGNGDIYVDVAAGSYVNITAPTADEVYIEGGSSFPIAAEASGEVSSMKIFIKEDADFEEKQSVAAGQEISYEYFPTTSGAIEIKVLAVIGGQEVESIQSVHVIIRSATINEPLPSGLLKGINYDASDLTKATLVLEAPGKEFAYVVGDFTNWEVLGSYQMKATPDGELFWLEIDGLIPGNEYVFQYWVEGNIKIGDPYADKVADPWNDQYIPEEVYPDLIAYDKTAYQMATVLQTDQPAYNWADSEENWVKPPKEELVIYEVLLRDFLGSHSYDDLTDTLSYLKRLGINAIELMPVMEFEGNDSWGYNPAYFFAPDKYYGTENDLKKFIETAHQEGIAVILDMVLNHAFGQNPMVKLYWDPTSNTVSENSPWFNPVATHPYNVGYDFNHESQYTKNFVDSVNRYWLEKYHFDGYRFDLSKGFTQQNSGDDVGAWGEYDVSRIALLKRMADKIWSHSPDAYVILEHFADNQEEKELAEYKADQGKGMLLWGNLNHAYNQNTMGYESESSIDWISHETRDWEVSHVVGYMESHDEDRLVYRNIAYGNSSGGYDVTDSTTAVSRIKAAGLLFYTLPGPKMIWQFGELGYDYSINWCTDGSIGDCRLVPKPPRWDYKNVAIRSNLFEHTADLLRLRSTYNVFTSGTAIFHSGDDLVKQITLLNEADISSPTSADEMNVQLVANFELSEKAIEVAFPHEGTWYDYYNGGAAVEVSGTTHTITLGPGKYKLYTDYAIEAPPVIAGVVNLEKKGQITLYPNPSEDFLKVTGSTQNIEEITLATLHGKIIHPTRISQDQWDVRNIVPGLYIAMIRVGGKAYYTKFLVK